MQLPGNTGLLRNQTTRALQVCACAQMRSCGYARMRRRSHTGAFRPRAIVGDAAFGVVRRARIYTAATSILLHTGENATQSALGVRLGSTKYLVVPRQSDLSATHRDTGYPYRCRLTSRRCRAASWPRTEMWVESITQHIGQWAPYRHQGVYCTCE